MEEAEGAEDASLTAQVLEKLFPAEVVTSEESWHTLHVSLSKTVLTALNPSELALDFAGQVYLSHMHCLSAVRVQRSLPQHRLHASGRVSREHLDMQSKYAILSATFPKS